MGLKAIEVRRGSALLPGVFRIYLDVFPEYERVPEEAVLRMIEIHPEFVSLTAYMEDDAVERPENVQALTFAIDFPDLPFVYLLFLGIDAEYQGCGKGSDILNRLELRYDEPILLDVEVIDDPKAENKEQRRSRWRFYEKNGFEMTDMLLHTRGVDYQILTKGMHLSKDQVAKLETEKDCLYEDPRLADAWGNYS